ncbi:hypothetical protein H6Y62_11175 [Staphylococcus lugdunensis]|uniref:Uncharacterized protein n=1 Tax=Staphylococcus lugdunensis TaxID=28035 RepID=A0A133Q0T1_STALU|nr:MULTISPECIES: hypothetical protein [Staphylococcus]AMG61406.1 hypothetical protein AL499_05410 [Staphylococcus lugdunensis]AMG64701.1 hypothetical protein AL501_10775 [Staphylococcus lugdunensis]ARB78505.1 hypothetical protein A6J61_09345 [Staphylococcus lugdunensis]ARJ12222.1 hypothetical protein B7466_10630 [Staphylococcus lugdunensis]ARJ14726.1 hypothetical protein B7468_10420 [Staphylococcus lugdunensis]
MQMKLREQELIDFLEINFPDKEFKKGRMLVGQHHRDDLTVYYLGEELFAAIIVAFNTFETREAMLLDYTAVKDITLKEGWLYRKMIITTENERMKYGTSKVLLSDFQTENFNYFIDGQKERVIFKNGKFV